MSLISRIFFAIVFTLVTGMIAYGIWRMLHIKLFCINPDFVYLTLRVVCLLNVLPIGFALLQTTWRGGFLRTEEIWQLHFSMTGVMKLPLILLIGIWCVLIWRNLRRYVEDTHAWRDVIGGNIPEDDDIAIEEFARIKKELKVHRRIQLYRNDLLQSPMITGVFFCKIILPYQEYSREQLAVIYYHELMHYKSCDLIYKLIARIIGVLLPMKETIEQLTSELNEWSEYHCDARAIEAMGDTRQGRRYFGVIMGIMTCKTEISKEDYIFSSLYENHIFLERRIEHMKKYSEFKKAAKGVSVLLALSFVLASVTPVYAAGTQISAANDWVYEKVEAPVEYTVEEPELHFIPAEEDNTYTELVYAYPEQEYIMPVLSENEIVTYNWTVTPGTRTVSSQFYVKSGQKIQATAGVVPNNVTFWLGVMNSAGDAWYVSASGSVGYGFPVSSSGYYRVFVQNRGSQNITAAGNYYYCTP